MIVFIAHYGNLYGANISLLTFLKETSIPKKDFVVIVPTAGSFKSELEKENITCLVQWFAYNTEGENTPLFRRYSNILKKIRWLFKLYFLIRSLNPKLIYSNSSVVYYGHFIAKALSIPHIWHLREFGNLDYHLLPDFGLNFQRRIINKSNHVIAISKAIATHYHLKQNNSCVIYNGVTKNSDSFKTNNFDRPLKFGLVGLISPYKNQLKAVIAFHQFNKNLKQGSHLYIIGGVGDGIYLEEIKNYIDNHQLNSQVTIVGHVNSSAEIYALFDILINPSMYEGFGRVTVEAMVYGKIPIGLRHSGTQEIIEHGVTGFLYDTDTELTELMLDANNDRNELRRLQQSILINFNRRFTSAYYTSSIDDVIVKTLNLQHK